MGWSYGGSHGIEREGGGGGRWAGDNPGMTTRAGAGGGRATNKWLHSRLPPQGGLRVLSDWLDVGYMKASVMVQAVKKAPAMQKPQET